MIFYAAGFLTFSIVSGVMMYSQYEANQPGVSVSALKEYRALQKDMGGDPAEIASDIALHRGSYTQIVQHKIDDQLFDPLIGLLGALFETLPLMLIGMGMAQNGFITGQGTAGQYRKWTFWAGGGGLLLTGICAYINYRSGFDPVTVMAVEMAATQPGRILMTIGYAALLILIVRRFAHSGLLQRIMAAGRAAFTNYLGTSILMTTLFYGYGLGLYGHIGRAQLYLFVLAAWAVMLFWSKPWLVHFHYGPLEWLWRSLARGRLQPFGRNGAPPPPD
ncbi:MAG: DUF418 domain-containing protein [Sphingomonadales bacterium]|nr:DUF418 domain-containing protein [Sphingomonadales bacterium]